MNKLFKTKTDGMTEFQKREVKKLQKKAFDCSLKAMKGQLTKKDVDEYEKYCESYNAKYPNADYEKTTKPRIQKLRQICK